jgi:hypothetical protein
VPEVVIRYVAEQLGIEDWTVVKRYGDRRELFDRAVLWLIENRVLLPRIDYPELRLETYAKAGMLDRMHRQAGGHRHHRRLGRRAGGLARCSSWTPFTAWTPPSTPR